MPIIAFTTLPIIMTEVVKFNIGGQRYEVSRSLLCIYPESMLAKCASDQWQEDPEAEIFIEGDGDLFRYVLIYLRHGSVCLPVTESNGALMKELEFYGIDVNEESICNAETDKVMALQTFKIAIAELMNYTESLHAEYCCSQLAHDCILAYLETMKDSIISSRKVQSRHRELVSHLNQDERTAKNIRTLLSLVKKDVEVKKRVNVHLNKVGLHLTNFQTRYYCNAGSKIMTATLMELNLVPTK